MAQRVNIASGEDAGFKYEPAAAHTYESFALRQRRRMEDALRNQQAIEGSVNGAPRVIYLRDESGFGPADLPVAVADLNAPCEDGHCGC